MDLYNLIAQWLGWPILVALLLLAGGFGYWMLKTRVENLRSENDLLRTKVSETDKFSPDILVERLANRLKILSEELERLNIDDTNLQKIIQDIEFDTSNIINILLHFFRQKIHSILSDVEVIRQNYESGRIGQISHNLDKIEAHISDIREYLMSQDQNISKIKKRSADNNPVFINQSSEKRILILEDDEYVLDNYLTFFESSTTIQIESAVCVEDALQLVKNTDRFFDLMMIDMMIPYSIEDHNSIKNKRLELTELRKIMIEAELSEENNSRFSYKQAKRHIKEMENRVLHEGGVLFLEELRRILPQKEKKPRIIFVSALSDHRENDIKQKFPEFKVLWFEKPVATNLLKDAILNNLQN